MQKNIGIKIIFLIGILFSTLLSADQIVSREGDIVTVIASGEYIMGDSDNRKEARTMALTQAKTNASEVAGTYIESNFESVTKQTNGDTVDKVTKQELRSFSAAILQTEITNDTMEMLANKTTVYKVSIKARIDLATLRERVKQLGEDKAKKDRLIGLEKENKDLSSALEKLSGQMRTLENTKSVKPEEIKALRDERDRLFTKLEKNEGATKLVFEKGSVLNEYQQKVVRATEIAQAVNDTLINHLSECIDVNIEKPKIVSQRGDRFVLEVKYSWDFNHEKMSKILLDNYSVENDSFEDGIILNHRKMGFDISRDRDIIKSIPKHKACILLSNIAIPIFHNISDSTSLYKPFILTSERRGTATFEMSQEHLEMFTEVTSRIVVDGECRWYVGEK